MHFHVNSARKTEASFSHDHEVYLRFTDEVASLDDLGREPQRGDRVTFDLSRDKPKGKRRHRKATRWTFTETWDQDLEAAREEARHRAELAAEDEAAADELFDEEPPPTQHEVRNRALRAFGGNTEAAREAASMTPGDFI